ncbi:MAG: lysylphosphatidylglycerol synthase domain-containing protein [Pyrinomonadaceae bacterium]
MQSEKYLDGELQAAEQPARKRRSKKTNLLISVHAITFLIGLAVLIFVIYRIGYQSLLDSLASVGWGFAAILTLNLTRHLLRSASMYLAIAPDHRNFRFHNAVAARFGGEAVNFFSFTGPFLGDATRAVLLKKDISLTQSASAVIIDNILYYVTVVLMVLAGVVVLLINYGSSGSTMTRVLLAIVLVALALFAALMIAILKRVKPISRIIGFMEKRDIAPSFLMRKRPGLLDVERNVFQFYHDRKADFFTLFGISLSVHAISVVEVFFALRFLGYDAAVSVAFIIESLTKVINAVFGFIPGTIGVYEGGNGLILKTLGYTTALGVALALVRRGAILFSTFLGLVILLWRGAARGAKHLAEKN